MFLVALELSKLEVQKKEQQSKELEQKEGRTNDWRVYQGMKSEERSNEEANEHKKVEEEAKKDPQLMKIPSMDEMLHIKLPSLSQQDREAL